MKFSQPTLCIYLKSSRPITFPNLITALQREAITSSKNVFKLIELSDLQTLTHIKITLLLNISIHNIFYSDSRKIYD